MDDVIKLIAETYTEDELKQKVPTESTREIFATIKSIDRTEWHNAGHNGLQPSFIAVTPSINYNGEKLVEWNGTRYTVYRTYSKADSDEMELYLEKKAGS